jgi:hypothetical protein
MDTALSFQTSLNYSMPPREDVRGRKLSSGAVFTPHKVMGGKKSWVLFKSPQPAASEQAIAQKLNAITFPQK